MVQAPCLGSEVGEEMDQRDPLFFRLGWWISFRWIWHDLATLANISQLVLEFGRGFSPLGPTVMYLLEDTGQKRMFQRFQGSVPFNASTLYNLNGFKWCVCSWISILGSTRLSVS